MLGSTPVGSHQLNVALVVVVRQTENGNSQADNGHGSQKHHDEDERLVHLVQMQQNRIAVLVHVLQASVIACAKTNRRQAEANHGAGDNDCSAKWSHKFLRELSEIRMPEAEQRNS